jgi:hypothetical protein
MFYSSLFLSWSGEMFADFVYLSKDIFSFNDMFYFSGPISVVCALVFVFSLSINFYVQFVITF